MNMQSWRNSRNPVLPPDLCIPDVEAHVFDGKLCLYGSHDQSGDAYCSRDYHVITTEDMRTWQIGDVAFEGGQIPWLDRENPYYAQDYDFRNPTKFLTGMLKEMGFDLENIPRDQLPEHLDMGKYVADRKILFAPDGSFRDGKYYLYFCTSGYMEGVAVADRPEGPYTDPVQLPCAGIDPAVFIDDDGTAYFYWGQFRSAGARLGRDMRSFEEGSEVRNLLTEEVHGFHEGSSMRKRNGIYYYVYPCIFREGKPTCLAYATSDRPLGEFTYRGIIIDNAKCDPQSWNIHGSIEQFNGQWYVFYHRSSGNSRVQRRLCIEPISFLDDGTIPEVKMTSIGAGDPFVRGERIEGWRACEVEGGAYIENDKLIMTDGSEALFRYVEIREPLSSVRIESSGSGTVRALIDGRSAYGDIPIGVYELRLVCTGEAEVQSITML